jgi:hypothetical protein
MPHVCILHALRHRLDVTTLFKGSGDAMGLGLVCSLAGATAVAATIALITPSHERDAPTAPWVPTLGSADQYRHIALPVTAPPEGALVQVYSSADPVYSGEQLAFQYNGYTVSVCTRDVTRSDPTACDPQPGQGSDLVRRFEHGEYVTTIRSYGKFGESAGGAAAEAASLFTSADLAENPRWLGAYAKRNNERIAG